MLKVGGVIFGLHLLIPILLLYTTCSTDQGHVECPPIKEPKQITVTATMYEPLKAQTDDTPNLTADGTRINTKYAGKYRYLAVSRDLLEIVEYGDYVVIEGIDGKYDGVWQVKDTMHPRWENRIDLLCNPGTSPFRKDSATLIIYN